MNKLLKYLTAAGFAATAVTGSFGPAQAIPMPAAKAAVVSHVDQIQYRRDWRDRRGWYNGHRGYRDRRPGYRYHNGFWFPLAAFGAGALIGGALSAPTRSAETSSHVQWCADRYRSYRASDNTYVVRAGVRAVCRSPYN